MSWASHGFFLGYVTDAVVWNLGSVLDLNLSCARDFWNQLFYGDLVYKFKKNVGTGGFSVRFVKIMSHYKKR